MKEEKQRKKKPGGEIIFFPTKHPKQLCFVFPPAPLAEAD